MLASDFVQGLRRAVNPKTASGSAALLSVIKNAEDIIAGRKDVIELGITSSGESTVRIELERPAPFILEILSQPIAAPNHRAIDNTKFDDLLKNKSSATNGAYTLTAHVPGSYIELTRNPYYWDKKNVAIEKVRYLNSESAETELQEYLAGQLDLTFTIPAPDLERVTRAYPLEVQSKEILATLYLALNLSNGPLSTGSEIRQALSMAVDRDFIADRIQVGVSPAYSYVAKGNLGYIPASYSWSPWNRDQQLKEARDHYRNAGYTPRNPLHLKLYFNQDEGIRRLMIAIAGSWKQNLGVESELISDEFRVFLAGRKDKSRWDVVRLGWSADFDDPSSFLDVFAPGGSQNDPGYKDPKFDSRLGEAESETQEDVRLKLFSQAEQILLDDYPIIPIYFYRARRLVKPYIGGAQLTPMNRTYSKHLFFISPN